jgi:hypothetical protein
VESVSLHRLKEEALGEDLCLQILVETQVEYVDVWVKVPFLLRLSLPLDLKLEALQKE